MSNNIVAVEIDGIVSYHLPDSDYATLCGIDGGLSSDFYNQRLVDTPKNTKINCPTCHKIWKICNGFTAGDFSQCHI